MRGVINILSLAKKIERPAHPGGTNARIYQIGECLGEELANGEDRDVGVSAQIQEVIVIGDVGVNHHPQE